MKRALLGLSMVILVLATGCDKEIPYTELESGFAYKFIENAEGKKAVRGDIMMIDLKTLYDNDSVMIERIGADNLPINPFSGPMGGLQEILNLCDEGDSIHVRMSLNKYAEVTRTALNASMDTAKSVVWHMRIAEVENESTLLVREKEKQKEIDNEIIQKYIADKGLNATAATEGIFQVVLEEGDGPKPEPGQRVFVNYAVRMLDGTLVDTSYEELAKENGIYNASRQYEPYGFVLGNDRVIDGWHKGIAYVNKGGKSILIIPSELAYGQRGNNGIPPNAVLVFDLEVVDIK